MPLRIIEQRWFEARGVVGFRPANSVGDDVLFYADESRTAELGRAGVSVGAEWWLHAGRDGVFVQE
jgi:cobalamin-dependent methionine synthase I